MPLETLTTIQRSFAQAIMRPAGRASRLENVAAAEALIKPNRLLTAPQRMDIYHRQYWLRVPECLAEDFPGVKALVGRRFKALCAAYLARYPSSSFTLRDLGHMLPRFMREPGNWQVDLTRERCQMAMEMAALEWAQVIAFDSARLPAASIAQIESGQFGLQPFLTLLELHWSLDQYLLELRRKKPVRPPQPERLLLAVHRFEDTVHLKRLEPWQFRVLRSIARGATLPEAMRCACADPHSVRSAFSQWMSWNWFSVRED